MGSSSGLKQHGEDPAQRQAPRRNSGGRSFHQRRQRRKFNASAARLDFRRRAEALRGDLVSAVQGHTNIQVLTQATCNAWFTDNYLPVIQSRRMYKVRARQCIVSAGSFDQPVVFRNNDLPGVMLTSAALVIA